MQLVLKNVKNYKLKINIKNYHTPYILPSPLHVSAIISYRQKA
jgi:hypothetical protein